MSDYDFIDHSYDVVVIGSGLAGLTAANVLARTGRSVLLLEQHYKLGGMATWFKRPGGHIFDISLHGFPIGMRKSFRKYWGQPFSERIIQVKNIRFDIRVFFPKLFHNNIVLFAIPNFDVRTIFITVILTKLI